MIDVRNGDALEILKTLPDNSVDSIVADPPYGLSKQPDMAEVLRHWLAGDDYTHKGGGFMGKTWDSFVPGPAIWKECLRVLKPGGHLLSFFGSRTYDLGTLAIRLAGFEIRDQIMWVYGSGFPKSLDVSKAIDKAAGVQREVIGVHRRHGGGNAVSGSMSGPLGTESQLPLTAPATDAAKQWDGWGTALKPAHEPLVLARKPLIGTVAQNVLEHGTGALNIDGCRIGDGSDKISRGCAEVEPLHGGGISTRSPVDYSKGRWPANFIHDGSDEVLEAFAETTSGSAARFFYCAKASKKDRGPDNLHPTVKPVDLMRYLVRLVTPPGGVTLDPFLGSGTTGVAAVLEGFSILGIEQDAEYAELSRRRINAAVPLLTVV